MTQEEMNQMLESPVSKSKIYNYESLEEYGKATILNGCPNGIINFNKTSHPWAYGMFQRMQQRDWTPSQVNVGQDQRNYVHLSGPEKRMYDLVLAQLITNDSIQTQQLMIGISSFVTSPVVSACLARQSYEEALHAQSYTVMAEDICGDTDRIYNLWKEDAELFEKNKSVADMYQAIYPKTGEATLEDVLMAFVANQILEELVFPGGFVSMYKLEKVMVGSAEMISEINNLGLPVEESAA